MQNIVEQPEQGKRKRGEKREDGRTFFCYRGDGREVWGTPQSLELQREKNRIRAKALRAKRKLAGIKPIRPENPLKRGYCHENGTIFWKYRSDGKESWVSVAKFAELKKRTAESSNRNRKNNPEASREKCRKWRRNNPSKQREATIRWKAKNKEVYNASVLRNRQNRRKTDVLFAEKGRMRNRLADAIKRAGFKKSSKTRDMIGCDWPTLVSHIESHFLPNMGWHNRHLWEVDHHIPVSIAKNFEELSILAHFSNLRPLWAADNQRKRDKLPEDFVDRYEALCKITARA